MTPPFRAEHIGSLLRPEGLLRGESPDRYIVEAPRWQERLGLEVVTDGEFRRESWRLGFVAKVAGFPAPSSPTRSPSAFRSRIGP
ncbi:MAG: hypothetical protein ACT4P4_11400 [Betaproteobacteria bacterium]